MNLNPTVPPLIYLGVGFWIIKFARQTYLRPDSSLQRSYTYLPRNNWTWGALRGFSVLWMFGGILVILNGVVPFLNKYRGVSMMVVFVAIAVVGTLLLLPRQKSTLR
jgi:hypothetical protein